MTRTPEQRTETAERAGRLGWDIWLSLLPHTDMPDKLVSRRAARNAARPAEEFRLTEVESADQLRPRDVILNLEHDGRPEIENNRLMHYATPREAVKARESAVFVVATVSAKSVTVHDLAHLPTGGPGSCDPDRLGQPRPYGDEPTTTRLMIPSDARRVARLGHADDFQARIKAHPDYPAWRAAYAQWQRDQEEAQEEARRRKAAQEAAAKPLQEAADRLAEILGERLITVEVPYFGSEPPKVRPVDPWLGKGERLYVYVVGLARLRETGRSEADEIRKHLRTLGFWPQETEPEPVSLPDLLKSIEADTPYLALESPDGQEWGDVDRDTHINDGRHVRKVLRAFTKHGGYVASGDADVVVLTPTRASEPGASHYRFVRAARAGALLTLLRTHLAYADDDTALCAAPSDGHRFTTDPADATCPACLAEYNSMISKES